METNSTTTERAPRTYYLVEARWAAGRRYEDRLAGCFSYRQAVLERVRAERRRPASSFSLKPSTPVVAP